MKKRSSTFERGLRLRQAVEKSAIYSLQKELCRMSGLSKTEQEEGKEISLPYANNAHALSRAISLQIDDVAEQITSKLHAFFEVHGSEAVLQNPTGKIVFNIELSRVDNKLGNKVYHVVETD